MEDLFSKGVRLFNEEKFFEAHEIWELIWKNARDDKKFLQGLIFIAGAFHHLNSSNPAGGKKFLKKGLDCIDNYPTKNLGIDVMKLKEEVRENLTSIKKGMALSKIHLQ